MSTMCMNAQHDIQRGPPLQSGSAVGFAGGLHPPYKSPVRRSLSAAPYLPPVARRRRETLIPRLEQDSNDQHTMTKQIQDTKFKTGTATAGDHRTESAERSKLDGGFRLRAPPTLQIPCSLIAVSWQDSAEYYRERRANCLFSVTTGLWTCQLVGCIMDS